MMTALFVSSCSKPDPNAPEAVIAEGSGVSVTRVELNKTVEQELAAYGLTREMYTREKLGRLEARAAKLLVIEQLLLAKARELKLDEAMIHEKADARFNTDAGNYPTIEMFRERLARNSRSEPEYRDDLRKQVIIDETVQRLLPEPAAPDQAAIENLYKAHEAQLQRADEEVRVSHVLVKVPTTADKKAKGELRKRIEVARKRLTGGEDFAAVAKEVSEDPSSAAAGGDLGFFKRGEMIGEFEAVAFSAEPGKITDVFETPFGYHFLKVTGKRPKGRIPLAEVQPALVDYLKAVKRSEELKVYLEKLEKEARVAYSIPIPDDVSLPAPGSGPEGPPSALNSAAAAPGP
jgi:parvulin-like peptidyl-prolyl isomerase